jgi:hypothetical protein
LGSIRRFAAWQSRFRGFPFDRYGHLMPGSEREAAGMLDAFLVRASSQARLAGAPSAQTTILDTMPPTR